MKKSQETYDTIVIGAGIAGCCVALALQKKGQKVLLIDRSAAAASGGSGAAGAFVSPKIGMGSELQVLTNEAYSYAKNFYLKYFPNLFNQSGVIRIPKDKDDSEKFAAYNQYNTNEYENYNSEQLASHGICSQESGFYFPEAGVCDAVGLCAAMMQHVPFLQANVEALKKDVNDWVIAPKGLRAKNIVLATGYQNEIFEMGYMGITGTWGSRGDYFSSLPLTVSMHKSLSVSANIEGVIKVGATHVKSKTPCLECKGDPLEKLFKKASETVDTRDFKLKEVFCGMRSGSKDYFPLAGKIIDVEAMLELHPNLLKGAKPELQYLENIYVCNGVGGRGFVFSPLMAKWLSEYIVDKKEIDNRVNPDRLFYRWCRKKNNK